MFQRAPRVPDTDTEKTFTFAEQQRTVRHLRALNKLTAYALLPASLLTSAYWSDVGVNQERERAATIRLDDHDVDAFDTGGANTIFIDGYGSMNATYLAEKFGPAVQQVSEGTIKSANFSDAPIEASRLADSIIEAAEAIITDTENNLQLETLYFAATPSGPESLREGQVEKIELLNMIADAPGAKYSSAVRFLISMVSDYDQYAGKSFEKIVDVTLSNIEQIQYHTEPRVRQLDDQTLAIMNANLEKNFQRIGEMRGEKQMPVIVYLAAEDPTADTTVDNDAAAAAICEAAEAARLTCLKLAVPGAEHSVYNMSAEAYGDVLIAAKPRIQSLVETENDFHEAATTTRRSHPTSLLPQ